MQPHGIDQFDATFARDLAWAQKLHEQLDELPTTDDAETNDVAH